MISMSDLTTLKTEKPHIGNFLESWLAENANRDFDLSDSKEQEAFLNAIEKMAKHIAHTSPSGKVSIIFDKIGVKTMFIHS